MTKNLIKFGDLTIRGEDPAGQEIIIEAPIRDLEIEVMDDFDVAWGSLDTVYLTRKEVTFKSTLVGEGKYTIKTVPAPTGVERTARVLGWSDEEAAVKREPTIALIKAAAEKAGVDENTDFQLIYEDNFKRNTLDVYVEFKWTE